MADDIEAHKVAFEKAKILHRVGNILVTHGGYGLLIDWDLCNKEDNNVQPQQAQRTGTWQFMAARILMSTKPVRHVLADDLESFFHVLAWIALRFTPHGLLPTKLAVWLRDVFDYAIYYPELGTSQGGENKKSHLKNEAMSQDAELPDGALKDLIVILESVCRVRYIKEPTAGQRKDYEITKERARTSELDKDRLQREYAYIYDSNMEALKTSDWMLEQFRTAAQKYNQLRTPRTVHVLPKSEEDAETKKRKTDISPLDPGLSGSIDGDEDQGQDLELLNFAAGPKTVDTNKGLGNESWSDWAEDEPVYELEFEAEE